jgi:hypothetical protein
MQARTLHVSTVWMLMRTTTFYVAIATCVRLLIPHLVPDNHLHAAQRVLNLGKAGNLLGRELMPAQTAGQICSELQLPQPHLEQLPAVRTGQINPCAPVILEQAVVSG